VRRIIIAALLAGAALGCLNGCGAPAQTAIVLTPTPGSLGFCPQRYRCEHFFFQICLADARQVPIRGQSAPRPCDAATDLLMTTCLSGIILAGMQHRRLPISYLRCTRTYAFTMYGDVAFDGSRVSYLPSLAGCLRAQSTMVRLTVRCAAHGGTSQGSPAALEARVQVAGRTLIWKGAWFRRAYRVVVGADVHGRLSASAFRV